VYFLFFVFVQCLFDLGWNISFDQMIFASSTL